MDNRANIKIEFKIFGEEFKTEMSINYIPDDDIGIDFNIVEYFVYAYKKAKYKSELKKLENKNG